MEKCKDKATYRTSSTATNSSSDALQLLSLLLLLAVYIAYIRSVLTLCCCLLHATDSETPRRFRSTVLYTRRFACRAVLPATLAHSERSQQIDGPNVWVQTGDLQMPRVPCSRKTTPTPPALTIRTYHVHTFVRNKRHITAWRCTALLREMS